jgi:response regulator RpfG family c-di-GMP phosphodiesterase
MTDAKPAIKLTMLIVDDEQKVVEALYQLFDNDFHVFTANDGETAIKIAEQKPDLAIVICDQRMPGMKGVDVLKHIRDIRPDAMRILLTGYADLDSVLESVNVGEVFRYVRKPWQSSVLKSIVAMAAASYMLKRQKRAATDGDTSTSAPSPTSLSTEPEKQTFASFEEEFFATFQQQTIDEIKQYQSFEEEFFARLNEQALTASELPAPTDQAAQEPIEPLHSYDKHHDLRKIVYGRDGKPKVLVVDDEKRVLITLTDLLRNEFDVIACISGQAALDVLENNSLIAAVLSDQRMPNISGVDFLIAAHKIAPIVPKILMTGYADVNDVVRLVNEGQIFRFVQKPWDINKLKKTLYEATDEFEKRIEDGLKIRQWTLKAAEDNKKTAAMVEHIRGTSNPQSDLEIDGLKKLAALLKKSDKK